MPANTLLSDKTQPTGYFGRIGRSYTAVGSTPKSKGSNQSMIARIITENKDLTRKQIDQYVKANRAATDPVNPRPFLLQDLFDDLERDGHFKSQANLRDMATLGHPFQVSDDITGDINEEVTKLFRRSWFYEFIEMALLYFRKGYGVLELMNPVKYTDGQYTLEFNAIPRRNVIASKKFVVFEVNGDNGIYYGEGFEDRIIEIGKPGFLGYMNDIIPQLIWKRNAQQSWAEFSEKFGMPLITATSNKTNQGDLDKLEALLAALGESARAVLPEGTTIDIKAFAGKDSFQVYDMQINRCNSEISKPIVGGTMTTDNGSSRSQSEVHERNLDDKIAQGDRTKMMFLVNDKLIPLMRAWGWPIPENVTFNYPESFEIDLKDHWTIVAGILEHYDVPIEWISKRFNVPIDAVKKTLPGEPPAKPKPTARKRKTKPAASFFD